METHPGPTGSTPPLKSESSSPTNIDESRIREAASNAAGLRQDDMEAESSNKTTTPMMDTDDAKITPSLAEADGIGSQSGGSSPTVDADIGTPDLCSTEKATQRVAGNEAFEEAAKPPAHKRRTDPRTRNNHQCGSCDACMIDDCGECKNCLNRPRFGGRVKKSRRCMNRPKCLYPPEAKKKTTPSEVSSLIDDKSLLTISRLRQDRKREAPTAAAADASGTAAASGTGSTSSAHITSSARNSARKQQQEKQDASNECFGPPEAKKRTTPSEVSSLIDDKSLLTQNRLRQNRKRKAPTAAADADITAVASANTASTVPVRSSARNRARKQRQEEEDAKSERICIKSTIGSISSRGATSRSTEVAAKKSGESTTSKRKEKTITSNKAVEKDGWSCERCDNLNAPEKQRCSVCLGWAWKRRKQGTHSASSTCTNTTTTTTAAAAAVTSSCKKQKTPNTVAVMAIVGGEKAPRPEDKEAKLPARRSTAKSKSFVEPGSVKLDPLGETNALPVFPNTGRCEWSFDDTSRVLLAKFSFDCSDTMHPVDQQFLLQMMERDDVTVISEGLVNDLDPAMWDLQFISGVAGHEYCHKIRRFSRQVVDESKLVAPGDEAEGGAKRYCVTHKEEDGYVSMKLSDYIAYLDKRAAALQLVTTVGKEDELHPDNPKTQNDQGVGRQIQEDKVEPSEVFAFIGHDGKECSINVLDEVLYLTDYDLVKHLPALDGDLKDKFKLSGCLPGGRHCMMNGVNVNGRPFMGPNFYVTPPASFTHFHQDGHGTVDSGHICLSGFNEVVMLRRMPEQHKKRALYILNEGDKRKGKNRSTYDGLYGFPHGDGLGEKPLWPSHDAIQECREMKYYPSVFILKPGQLVHINKGRLHAFRKLSPTALPASDCHAALRSELVEKAAIQKEQICVSVAWDWLYQGVTSEGINREIVSTLECARLNRKHYTQSLAIPETSLMHMARRFVAQHEQEMAANDAEKRLPLLSFQPSNQLAVEKEDVTDESSSQPPLVMLKGILPSLSYVINRHKMSHEAAQEMKGTKTPEGRVSEGRVSIAPRPNAWENSDAVTIDP